MNSSFISSKPDPEVIKTFACSTQLTMKFHTGFTTKMLENKDFSCFQTLKHCIYHAISIKYQLFAL